MFSGRVETIHLKRKRGAALERVERALGVARRGLEGDWHYDDPHRDRHKVPAHVTFIEAETLEAAARDYDMTIEPGESRRNIMTRGVPLNHLVGVRFRVGGMVCRGVELCDPCNHLQKLTQPRMKEVLTHRGGLRAEILEGGEVAVGDLVEEVS